MSKEGAVEFLLSVNQDPDFLIKVRESSHPGRGLVQAAREAGFDLTLWDIRQAAHQLAGRSYELSERHLEMVSGGNAPDWDEISSILEQLGETLPE